MTRQGAEFSWNGNPAEVNTRLHDAKIKFGDQEARILDTEFFSRQENDEGQYRIMTQIDSGLLVGVPYRGGVLPLISTREGSCVKLDEIEVLTGDKGRQRVQGPGRIARVLGLNKGDILRISIVDSQKPVLQIERP